MITGELICQVAIPVFSGLGVYFVSRIDDKKRYGYILGLCSQPFWFYTLWNHQQWGLFALSLFFTSQWIKGIYNYWFRKQEPDPIAGLRYAKYNKQHWLDVGLVKAITEKGVGWIGAIFYKGEYYKVECTRVFKPEDSTKEFEFLGLDEAGSVSEETWDKMQRIKEGKDV